MVKRILIVGSAQSGKSLLAAHIAVRLGGTWNAFSDEAPNFSRRMQTAMLHCSERGHDDSVVSVIDALDWLPATDRIGEAIYRLETDDGQGVASIYTFHVVKDGPAMWGHSALVAAMDVVIRVTKVMTGEIVASVVKASDPEDERLAGAYTIRVCGASGRAVPYLVQQPASGG